MTSSSRKGQSCHVSGEIVRAGLAGVVACAVMYGMSALLRTPTIPDLVEDHLVLAMPGPLFGVLIDALQHAGKILSEVLILALLMVLFAVLGMAFYSIARGSSPRRALLLPGAAWLLLNVVLVATAEATFAPGQHLAAAVAWLAVFAADTAMLEFGLVAWSGRRADAGRRRTLKLLFIGFGSGAIGLLGFREAVAWAHAFAPDTALTGLSPAITPTNDFYLVSKNLTDPAIDGSKWALAIGGACLNPIVLSLPELKAMTSKTEYVTLECISNPVGGKLMSTGEFAGVSLRDLLDKAVPADDARWVNFRSRDGYTESLDLSVATSSSDVLVAHSLNAKALAPEHGYPARLVVPGRYGMKSAKWLDEITLAADPIQGFWEAQGWDPDTQIHTTARFDVPAFPAFVREATVPLGGVAFAGTRGISKVEWSSDGGRSWSNAALEKPVSALTWQRWTSAWTPASQGIYSLVVRARDGFGQLQTSDSKGSYPQGATGYHSIIVVVEP